MAKHRHFDKHFKQAVIDDYYHNPRPEKQIADDWGISWHFVNVWLKEYQESKHKPISA